MAAKNAVLDAILSRRSVRQYTKDPVSKEDLTAILEAARWTPSGLNNQPWRFLVVKAGDQRQAMLAGCTKYSRIVSSAAALIALTLYVPDKYHTMKDTQAAGACIQNILLAAHSLGLGAVWLGEIVNQAPKVLEGLGLKPALHELQAVIAIGHPAERGQSDRVPLDNLLLEKL